METSTTSDPVRDWLLDLLRQRSLSVNAAAGRAGVSQSTLSRFLRGQTERLSPHIVEALRQALASHASPPPLRAAPSMMRLESPEPDAIPFWGIHPRGEDEFEANPLAVSFLSAPHLRNRSKLAAFYAPDDTMAPRWFAGEPVVVNLVRPAAVGAPCLTRLLHADDPNGNESFIFRVLGNRSDGRVHFHSYAEPDRMIGIEIRRVLEIRAVLGWSDILA